MSDPSTTVAPREWRDGPDGSRECDVLVTTPAGCGVLTTLIECKDFKKPVDVGYLDALVSKHADLATDMAVIFSNSGFTQTARNKATRKGIPLLGALREEDDRIVMKVQSYTYGRKVRLDSFTSEYIRPDGTSVAFGPNAGLDNIWYDGRRVREWMASRSEAVLVNPVVSGAHCKRYRFRKPLQFRFEGIPAEVQQIVLKWELTGQWYRIPTTFDSPLGIFDWLANAVILDPRLPTHKWTVAPDFSRAVRIKTPPRERLLSQLPADRIGGEWFQTAGFPAPSGKIPPLDKKILPEDLDDEMADLDTIPDSHRTSTPRAGLGAFFAPWRR